jgi:hypothetical protein
MKTAVEFLASVISQSGPITEDDFNSLVKQAKEMEKEQISEAYFKGWCCPHGEGFPETGEEYYNKTYINSPEIPTSSKQQEQTQDNNFLVWDKLFAKLAWRFKPMKSGDMFIDAEAVYEELKNEFNLTFKQ